MSGSAAAVPAAKPQTLDELMLAMDVVDTIRHRELLVERELGQGERDEALRTRLREIYTSQGLTVTDRIIDQGIKALRESRFVYPPAPRRTLAPYLDPPRPHRRHHRRHPDRRHSALGRLPIRHRRPRRTRR
jgi:hypothetical protein